MQENDNFTTICIDAKCGRIRLSKNMLSSLGYPKYIQLLINTEKQKIAIRCVDKDVPDAQTIRIKPIEKMTSKAYDFTSKTLTDKLVEAIGIVDGNCSYRLSGTIFSLERIAVFPFNTVEKV
ncbi:MAG: hypothetical protein SOX63_02495 [Eubacteriales bacterium]|nr:hypothetical protein [Eubacteriales bacterium]